jgi:hypothetical protein
MTTTVVALEVKAPEEKLTAARQAQPEVTIK